VHQSAYVWFSEAVELPSTSTPRAQQSLQRTACDGAGDGDNPVWISYTPRLAHSLRVKRAMYLEVGWVVYFPIREFVHLATRSSS
jgi:hypothetical protein